MREKAETVSRAHVGNTSHTHLFTLRLGNGGKSEETEMVRVVPGKRNCPLRAASFVSRVLSRNVDVVGVLARALVPAALDTVLEPVHCRNCRLRVLWCGC